MVTNKKDEILNLTKFKSNLTFKDLKIQSIIRGMDFDKVINSSAGVLESFLIKNVYADVDFEKVKQFDDYVDSILKALGKDELVHPSLRLSTIDEGTVKNTVKKIVKKKTIKKEKDVNGIIKHTKKSLTFKCQKKGLTLEETIEKVKNKFPEANHKSIKIWYKTSERKSN